MSITYEVLMQDGEEITVEGAEDVRQNFGFIEFHNEDDDLVIALRADQIRQYTRGHKVTVPARVTSRTAKRK